MAKKEKIASVNQVKEQLTSNWLRQRAAERFDTSHALDLVVDVIKGEAIDRHIAADGALSKVPATARDRVKAAELLKLWGFGSDDKMLTVKLDFVTDFVGRITSLISRVVPHKCPHCASELGVRERLIDGMEDMQKQEITV